MLFSAGELDNEPEYEGFAFGNNKIRRLHVRQAGAVLLPWPKRQDGNRPFAIGGPLKQYEQATKAIGSGGFKPFFTYLPDNNRTRRNSVERTTPSQSSTFGQYSPIRNGHAWKYEFKYPGKGDGDVDKRDLIYGTRRKHVSGYHAGQDQTDWIAKRIALWIQDNNSDKIFQSSDD